MEVDVFYPNWICACVRLIYPLCGMWVGVELCHTLASLNHYLRNESNISLRTFSMCVCV